MDGIKEFFDVAIATGKVAEEVFTLEQVKKIPSSSIEDFGYDVTVDAKSDEGARMQCEAIQAHTEYMKSGKPYFIDKAMKDSTIAALEAGEIQHVFLLRNLSDEDAFGGMRVLTSVHAVKEGN